MILTIVAKLFEVIFAKPQLAPVESWERKAKTMLTFQTKCLIAEVRCQDLLYFGMDVKGNRRC